MAKERIIESPVGAEIVLDGRPYINFGGSSYLGLSSQPQILAAGAAALQECGSGYQFNRHFRVVTQAHEAAESQASDFFGTQAAMYLASGYYFGWTALAMLRAQIGAIFVDELAHFSLREAIAASGIPSHVFRHLDVQDLQSQLKQYAPAQGRPLIATDGMYSTIGEIAPLAEYAQLMAPYDGRLLIDESHGFGVLGAKGRGAYEHHGLADSLVLVGGSTGKAFGVVGGLIPAREQEVLMMRTTPVGRGAAAGLPAAAAMCARSLRYVREHPELIERLRANTAYMKSGLRRIGLEMPDTIAPVAAFKAKAGKSMAALQVQLMQDGIFVFHSNYIGAGADGLIRCGIFADHTNEHMDALFEALRRHL